jgi:hypothetical protein
VDSFLSAVHHFTGIRTFRGAERPIDARTLIWVPIVGLLTAFFTISFYIPLSAFYLPADVAVIPVLAAACWLRGFKPEIDFCNFCNSHFGSREKASSPGDVPGIACLVLAILFKYAIIRQFFALEAVRLLGFGTLISFVVALFHPERGAGWIKYLGIFWLVISAIATLSSMKTLGSAGLLTIFRGPLLAAALIYFCARMTFQLAEEPSSPNVAALPGELAAYVSFILVRYHFL